VFTADESSERFNDDATQFCYSGRARTLEEVLQFVVTNIAGYLPRSHGARVILRRAAWGGFCC
jgi:hypothetical protein